MKPRVYVETTIPSYLTSRPSRDLLVAAHQQLTSEWWSDQRHRFDLFISVRVVREAGSGDALAAARRLEPLAGIPLPEVTDEAVELARRFVAIARIPEKSAEDALHVAIAAVHGMDYLLTWNHEAPGGGRGKGRTGSARALHARTIDGTLKLCSIRLW